MKVSTFHDGARGYFSFSANRTCLHRRRRKTFEIGWSRLEIESSFTPIGEAFPKWLLRLETEA
jgi:hypothetical protein